MFDVRKDTAVCTGKKYGRCLLWKNLLSSANIERTLPENNDRFLLLSLSLKVEEDLYIYKKNCFQRGNSKKSFVY